MQEFTIVGIKAVDFDTKEGQHMKGVKLFVTGEDDKVEGLMTDSFFLSYEKFSNLDQYHVGDEIVIYYNRYGKVDSLTAA